MRKPHCHQCGRPMAGHTRRSSKWVCPEPTPESNANTPSPPSREKGKSRARDDASDDSSDDDFDIMDHDENIVSSDRDEDMEDGYEDEENDENAMQEDTEHNYHAAFDVGGRRRRVASDVDENEAGPSRNAIQRDDDPMGAGTLFDEGGGHWRNPRFVDEDTDDVAPWGHPHSSESPESDFGSASHPRGRVPFADISDYSRRSADSDSTSDSDDAEGPLAQMLLRPQGDLQRAFKQFADSSDPRASIFKVPLSQVDAVRTAATMVGLKSGILTVFVKEEDEEDDDEEKLVSLVIGLNGEVVDQVMDMHRASQCSIPQIIVQGPRSKPDMRYDALLSAGAFGGLAVFGCLIALTSRI